MPATIEAGKLYGITHDAASGMAIQRQVRVLKVGIGIPMGPDVDVWIDRDGTWRVEQGEYTGQNNKRVPKVQMCQNREEAEKAYGIARKNAPERRYPRKTPYFKFLRFRADGFYWPDFDAIQAHGPMPTEIDIVFLVNEPLDSRVQWYTAAEVKCEGDGINARRRLDLAKTDAEKKLAEVAAAEGDKFFQITNGCFARGCPYARGEKPVCKPHGRLYFQLLNSPRIGGTCTFDTTGFRSITQLFSCIQQIKAATGRGDSARGTVQGIPLKLVVRPYKTSHNGTPSTQYGVYLELRSNSPVELFKLLHGYADEFRVAARLGVPAKQITASEQLPEGAAIETEDDPPMDPDIDAAAMSAEFYPDTVDGDEAHQDIADDGEWEDPVPQREVQMPRRRSETAPDEAAQAVGQP